MNGRPFRNGRRGLAGALVLAMTWLPAAGRLQAQDAPAARAQPGRAPGLYAHFRTSEGTFIVRLMEGAAPKTVANFLGLAEGTLDPATGKPGQSAPFYDGLTFHRVIAGFIVQGGDPNGDGSGGPGYRIADEIAPERNGRFDRPGLVAMASRAPNQNGSQFFVTLAPAPTLDNKFTIFGEVVQGMDVVARIGNAPTHLLPGDRPIVPPRIESVRIERVSE